MKQIIRQVGIVLKTVDYKEQAVIATILTKEGKNNYIIKGAKKLSGGTRLLASPLTKIEFNSTSHDGLNTLTEGSIIDNYLPIKQNMNKLLVMYQVLEKILTFSDQVTNNLLFFEFVQDIFNLLSKDFDEDAILAIFDTKLTFLLGINPELKICPVCGREAKSGVFSINEGGIICDTCSLNYPSDLSKEDTEIFKLIYLLKLKNINNEYINYIKKHIKNINNMLDIYYQKHIDYISKSKQITQKLK